MHENAEAVGFGKASTVSAGQRGRAYPPCTINHLGHRGRGIPAAHHQVSSLEVGARGVVLREQPGSAARAARTGCSPQ